MILLKSPSDDPFFNVALEDYLVRNADTSTDMILLLYENKSCVMLGKNQSIYKEVNFDFLRKEDFVVARRISGGGTVYHGKGNLCFAFIAKFDDSKINNYQFFNQPIVTALIKAGVPANFNARNDIICEGYKVSGNAQFTNRKNILSHGTLLFDADLAQLNGALKKNEFTVVSKSVDSVRSPVKNISEFTNNFTDIAAFQDFLLQEMNIVKEIFLQKNEIVTISEKAKEFAMIDWIYGRSPATNIEKENCELSIKNGKIETINLPTDWKEWETKLQDEYYTYAILKNKIGNNSPLLKTIF